MIGLLQDPEVARYNILAIQEPWRNPHNDGGYNLNRSPFHLIEKGINNTRIAIYINKKIP